MPIVAALLAAGGGSRARQAGDAGHKLTAVRSGRAMYRWALDAVVAAGFEQVVVVSGAVDLEVPATARAASNPRWADGQASSLQVAIAVAVELDASAIVVGLADQPDVPTSAWRAIADAPVSWPIVVATYDGHRGPHPVRLDRSVWGYLPSSGDEGARTLLHRRPELVHEVPCAGSPADIDTPEDLQRWISS